MAILTRETFFTIGLSLLAASAVAEQASTPRFGGPDAVDNQVEDDFGETWDAWKQKLKDDLGLVLSVDYTAVMLTANETFDDKSGSGGIARIFGTYDLFSVENGTLVCRRLISRSDKSATSACRSHHSTTRTSARRTCTGGSA
jgi:hypothetical protein